LAVFSILLPTRNRATWARLAVESCLAQTFKEFELVVADNDDTDQTSAMLGAFQDPRLKVIRTGGLGMVDNWNEALDVARNEWILLIEDEILLPPESLDRLRKIVVSDADPPFVTWCVKSIADISELHQNTRRFVSCTTGS